MISKKVIISILATCFILNGCSKKEIEVQNTPIDGKDVIIEADNGNEHYAICKDDDSTFLYDYNKKEITERYKKTDREKAFWVEAKEWTKDTTDDISPYAISNSIVMTAPATFTYKDDEAELYLGYLKKKGYSVIEMYRNNDYCDFILTKVTNTIRVIITKKTIIFFSDVDKNLYSPMTYITDIKEKVISSVKTNIKQTKVSKTVSDKTESIKHKKDNIKASVADTKTAIKSLTLTDIFNNVIDCILASFKYSLNDVTLIPGKHLIEPMKICAGITVLSLICNLLEMPVLLDWRGAAVGTLILLALSYSSLIKKGDN